MKWPPMTWTTIFLTAELPPLLSDIPVVFPTSHSFSLQCSLPLCTNHFHKIQISSCHSPAYKSSKFPTAPRMKKKTLPWPSRLWRFWSPSNSQNSHYGPFVQSFLSTWIFSSKSSDLPHFKDFIQMPPNLQFRFRSCCFQALNTILIT